jgi:hypothetical protein
VKLAERIAALRARLDELQKRSRGRPTLIDLAALGISPPLANTSGGVRAPEGTRPRSRGNDDNAGSSATYGCDTTVSRP